MKSKIVVSLALSLSSVMSFGQFAQKKVVSNNGLQVVRPVALQPVKQPEKQAPQTNLQMAAVSILTGQDGKDNDTYVSIDLLDNNQRVAANYNNAPPVSIGIPARPNDEYFTGMSVTLPMKMEVSVPTGQIVQKGSLLLPVLREATITDFNNGGGIKITIQPNGHDTWKIQSLSVTFSFENDGSSPHTVVWNNLELSQDSRSRLLLFTKDFTAIQ